MRAELVPPPLIMGCRGSVYPMTESTMPLNSWEVLVMLRVMVKGICIRGRVNRALVMRICVFGWCLISVGLIGLWFGIGFVRLFVS